MKSNVDLIVLGISSKGVEWAAEQLSKIFKDKYEKKVGDIPQQIKDINKRLGEIDKEKEAIILKEKEDRRAVAETAMDREVHMELLNIIKEAGVSLKEGSDGVKTYYEIAKAAYLEGLTNGLRL